MAKEHEAFDFVTDRSGVRAVVRKQPLMPTCSSFSDIDTHIRMLKDDLDAVARRMKDALRG